MLGENGADLDFMGLRRAVGLPALASLQFLVPQRGSGSVGGDVDPRRLRFAGRLRSAQELLGQRSNETGQARELPGIHLQARVGAKRFLGSFERVFGGTPSDQGRHARRVAVDEPQRLVQGKTPPAVGGSVVIVADKGQVAEQGVGHALLAADPAFARLRPVARHSQSRQGQQPAQDVSAHALGSFAQSMLQPCDVAEFLGPQRFRCGIDEAVELLRPGVYGLVDFFLLSWTGRQTSASRPSTYSCASSMNRT